MKEKHISVLLEESISSLNLKDDSIIVDCTLGYGGHSSNILARIKKGFLFAFDQDSEAIRHSTDRLNAVGTNFTIVKSNFVHLKEKLQELGVEKVDGVLFDLGVSSPQLDDGERGFSYHEDARLDMRMDRDNPLSAYEVVNNYSKEELSKIFYKYGEDKFSNNIAKKIVEYRATKPIETTLELVEIIKTAVPMKFRIDKHPARQIFQAIRIEVNKELDVIEPALEQALSILKVGGRVAVITFHSLEDRLVKNFFKEKCAIDERLKGMPNIPEEYLPDFSLVVNKAISPTEEELENNPRARSAKLRVIERIK
jgi:16S rRNA (cytosine1402-N4)-methyltransferase